MLWRTCFDLVCSGGCLQSFAPGTAATKPLEMSILTKTLESGLRAIVYYQKNAQGPVSFTILVGQLCNGLKLSTDGVITGTPTKAGMWTFAVKVTDSHGSMVMQDYSIS